MEILADGHPMPAGDFIEALVATTDLGELAAAEGMSPADRFEVTRPLESPIWSDVGTVVRLDRRIDRVVLTHRLTPEEIARDELRTFPDLSLFGFDSHELRSDDGTTLDSFPWDTRVGPAGWLSDFEPGDVIAVRRSEDRRLSIERAEIASDAAREADALFDAWESLTNVDRPAIELSLVLARAVTLDGDAFSEPVDPIDELLERVNLEVRGEWVGPLGLDFTPGGFGELDEIEDEVADAYDLDPCCREALQAAIGAFSLYPEEFDAGVVSRVLEHGVVAPAFASWANAAFGLEDRGFERFIDDVIAGGRSHAAPALYIRSRVAEANGEILEAERYAESALRRDADFGPALERLAEYRIDRSDPRAASLLVRAGMPDDDPSLALARMLAGTQIDAGRNDPCPCGSGRKFKHCHLGRPTMTAAEKVRILMHKAARFVARSRELTISVAAILGSDLPETMLERVARDPFLHDVTMFEGGGLTEYLDTRGELLPPDELDVYEMWEGTPLSVWEVVESDGVSQVVLYDMVSAERITVHDRSMAKNHEAGDQFLARFVPYDERFWSSAAGVLLGPGLTESGLELVDSRAGRAQILEWFAGLHRPPEMVTTEGEPFTVSHARLTPTASWNRVIERLDDAYDRVEDDEWVEIFEHPERGSVRRASIRRDGEHLTVDTNSEPRMDRVITTLADVTEVADRSSEHWSDFAPYDETPAPSMPPLSDEDINAIRRQMSEGWLSESIPALGGLTPVEAVEDPTRRGDLIALLRDFDRRTQDGPMITMDLELIRERLGLRDD